MKNSFEHRDSETLIFLRDGLGLQVAKIDFSDFPTVTAFPGVWALPGASRGKRYVQGKWRNPQSGEHETVYLHRWVVGAEEETLVQVRADTLDCRRCNLQVTLKRHSYQRQVQRRGSETDRLQYTKALAARLARRSDRSPAQLLRGLQRGTLPVALEEAASRLAGERLQPAPVRLRAGWETRLPAILTAVHSSSAETIGRRDVEQLFGVSRATAVKLLDRFGASISVNALVLSKGDLVDRLTQLLADPTLTFVREAHNSTLAKVSEDRLGELLGAAAHRIRGNRVYVSGAEAKRHIESRFADLPDQVSLTPVELRLQFQGFEDFLQKVGAIVYALQNDAEAIEQFIAGG